MGELQDKVILVTGASRGIGRATCQVLAREGAKVVVSSIEPDEVKKVAVSLPGGVDERHLPLYLDVSSPTDRETGVAAALEHYGRLDGLVNNAGINFVKPFVDTSPDDWRHVMSVDLDSVYDLSHKAITQFLKQGGGSIVNVTSVHTKATYAGSAPYAAAKGAINMFAKGLAVEFSAQNIRVNCVAPGVVQTEIWNDMVADYGSEEALREHWNKNVPMERIIQPQEIGELVSFLLSDRASAISGSVVYADGGLTSQLISKM